MCLTLGIVTILAAWEAALNRDASIDAFSFRIQTMNRLELVERMPVSHSQCNSRCKKQTMPRASTYQVSQIHFSDCISMHPEDSKESIMPQGKDVVPGRRSVTVERAAAAIVATHFCSFCRKSYETLGRWSRVLVMCTYVANASTCQSNSRSRAKAKASKETLQRDPCLAISSLTSRRVCDRPNRNQASLGGSPFTNTTAA